MKPVQHFDNAYLEQCRKASTEQILEYLEQFHLLQGAVGQATSGSKLISLKVDKTLLAAFRAKCELNGVKYQTQIKRLIAEWIGGK